MTIFDKLGGADALHKVVDKFYELLLADAHLAPHFKGFDIAKVKQGQVEFLTETFGGPKIYHGRDLKTVHANLKISGKEFDDSWVHMEAALHSVGAKAELIAEIKGVYYSTKGVVATI